MGAKKTALVDDIAAVCARVGLDAVTVDADEAEVTRQAKGAKVGFLDALETALTTLIGPSNGKPGYDSAPWDYVTSVPESFGLASGATEDEIRAAVREVVNQRGTTIHLLCPGDYEEETVRSGIFAPEYGETTDANWVFYLPLDAFASLHWVIVDKAGEERAYCYGHD